MERKSKVEYVAADRNIQVKRERRKARKVVVERLRRERIDRCLDQLKHWLQDSTFLASQSDHCNLEKADILELTVNQLRHMVASIETQCAYGYSACVQEVDNFLLSVRYDDVTRRRIVQHLCRRRQQAIGGGGTGNGNHVGIYRLPPLDIEFTSGPDTDYQHLRMCSYNSADSTTEGVEPTDAGTLSTVSHACRNVENLEPSSLPSRKDIDNDVVGLDVSRSSECVVKADPDEQELESSGTTVATEAVDLRNDARAIDNMAFRRPSSSAELVSPVWRPWHILEDAGRFADSSI